MRLPHDVPASLANCPSGGAELVTVVRCSAQNATYIEEDGGNGDPAPHRRPSSGVPAVIVVHPALNLTAKKHIEERADNHRGPEDVEAAFDHVTSIAWRCR